MTDTTHDCSGEECTTCLALSHDYLVRVRHCGDLARHLCDAGAIDILTIALVAMSPDQLRWAEDRVARRLAADDPRLAIATEIASHLLPLSDAAIKDKVAHLLVPTYKLDQILVHIRADAALTKSPQLRLYEDGMTAAIAAASARADATADP